MYALEMQQVTKVNNDIFLEIHKMLKMFNAHCRILIGDKKKNNSHLG